MVSLLVADRNDIVRAGLASLMRDVGHEIIEARTPEELLSAVESYKPDVAILSEELFNHTEIDISLQLKQSHPSLRIILLLKRPEHVLFREADGVILNDATADQLLACLNSVCAGHRWADPVILNWLIEGPVSRSGDGQLTPREFQIAGLIARGLRNKEIAREMQVSEATVKMHLHHIYDKLNLNGRTELALRTRDLHEAADY